MLCLLSFSNFTLILSFPFYSLFTTINILLRYSISSSAFFLPQTRPFPALYLSKTPALLFSYPFLASILLPFSSFLSSLISLFFFLYAPPCSFSPFPKLRPLLLMLFFSYDRFLGVSSLRSKLKKNEPSLLPIKSYICTET